MTYRFKYDESNEKTTAEVLARLNPDSNMPNGVLGGGLLELPEQDIAAALGDRTIPDGARYLARVKYAGQENYYCDLAVSLYTAIMDKHGKVWMACNSHRPGLILDLAKLAALDYCHIDTCPACHGVAERMIGAKCMVCPDCRGTGVRATSDETRAEMLGLPLPAWERIWRPRLGSMHAVLRGWDEQAIRALVRRLFSDK